MSNIKYLLVITGPTGIGKTDLSIQLAKQWETDIISCDSRQIYREMVIGTAVPNSLQLAAVPHHFIGNISIHDYYNAFNYETDVLNLLKELNKPKGLVILAGGSGMYLDAVLYGMDDIPDPDPVIRDKLTHRMIQEGVEKLSQELKEIDPEYYNEVDINNPKRVLRGLEVWFSTGEKFSSFRIRQSAPRSFIPIIINLEMDREELYSRINMRVDIMMQAGLKEEAFSLYPNKNLNALNTVGYKELFNHFDGQYSEEEAVRLIKRNSRHYAKRQITWNKKYKGSMNFHPNDAAEIIKWVETQFVVPG